MRLADYAVAPITGATGSDSDPITFESSVYLARINFLAEEPGGADRMFLSDQNGPLYILDKSTRQFTEYLDFNGRNGAPGLYDRLYRDGGFATGLVSFQFDPDYANNGKFYTIHIEQGSSGSLTPNTANYPNLDISNYGVTSSVDSPGFGAFVDVLVEWTDVDPTNETFEGSARELLRMDQRSRIHPMGDIIFNPTAQPGDPDWRVMYVAVGDGGSGERQGFNEIETRRAPQRLDALTGKILRIIPDLDDHTDESFVSPNGKYRIPNDNPFTSLNDADVRDEIYALGLRNPHRLTWDVDPDNPEANKLIVNDIGLHTWEEINIVHAGGNYGYSQREGNEVLQGNNATSLPLPNPDVVTYYLDGDSPAGTVTPLYPMVQYGHGEPGQTGTVGDAISSGYVYRGNNIPSLHGKFIFGDISTGQLFWSDYEEMLAADDSDPTTLAAIHAIDLLWDDPNDGPDEGEQLYTDTSSGGIRGALHHIIEAGYEARDGEDPNLPGSAQATGDFGRADIRLQTDETGELFILSKSDGVIRYLIEAVGNADFDGDGKVDGGDFEIWQSRLGGAGDLSNGDADGDGWVTHADLRFWRQQYGTAQQIASVPEPTCWILALLAIPGAWRGRRPTAG